jgi:hypothetical protein
VSYQGQTAIIPFGRGGLLTDAPDTHVLPLNLIKADNVTLVNDVLEKDFGSMRWNETALATGIVNFCEWWPNEATQRVIALGADGKVYRFANAYSSAEVTPSGGAPTTLNTARLTQLVAAGQESQSRNRKLFILTGSSAVQVLSGDATVRTTIASPAADWSGTNQPFGGFMHRSRLFLFGNKNNPHGVYASPADDHEDFLDASTLLFSVYPGEGERIVCGFVYAKRAFVVKYPRGLYVLNDTDTNSANWFFERALGSFGATSPNGFAAFFDDCAVCNPFGGVSSIRASDTTLDVQSSDIFNVLRVQKYVRDEMARDVSQVRFGLYYEDKKQAYFTFRSASSQENDRLAILSFKEQNAPALTWSTKDQPNCLAAIKDASGIERPAYGASDGFIYTLDSENRWVGTPDGVTKAGYSIDAQTAHMDFRVVDAPSASRVKVFDALELVYQATGEYDVLVDVFLDGEFSETLRFRLSGGSELSSFRLDETRLDGEVPRYQIQDLHGEARTISLRFYQETEDDPGESVELIEARIYYRMSGNQQKGKA